MSHVDVVEQANSDACVRDGGMLHLTRESNDIVIVTKSEVSHSREINDKNGQLAMSRVEGFSLTKSWVPAFVSARGSYLPLGIQTFRRPTSLLWN